MASRRSRISREGVKIPDAPKQQEQFTPAFQSISPSVDKAGLSLLGSALASFFNQGGRAIEQMQKATEVNDRAQIAEENIAAQTAVRQENKDLQAAGFAKALSGEAPTEAEMGRHSFFDAYQRTLGEKMGGEAAMRFITHAKENIPVTADLTAAMNDWLSNELKNGDNRIGTGQPIFDASFLATFQKQTDQFRLQHDEAGIKSRINTAIMDKQSALVESLSTLEPGELPRHVEEMRALDPLHPELAPARVMSALLISGENNPKAMARVINLMHDPMSGDGKRSFSQLFPGAALETEQKLVTNYRERTSLEGLNLYDAARQKLAASDDVGQLVALRNWVMEVRNSYGGFNLASSLDGAIQTKLRPLLQGQLELNQMDAMAVQRMPLDVSLVRKRLGDYMKAKGVDWTKNPQGAAEIVNRFGVINDDMKAELGNALNNFDNPERFAAAMNFYQYVERHDDQNRAIDMMDPAVSHIYLHAKRTVELTRQPLQEVLTTMKDNRAALETSKKMTWGDVLGQPGKLAESEATVKDRILSEIKEQYGENVKVVDPVVLNDLMDHAKTIYTFRNRTGGMDWKSVVKDAVTTMRAAIPVYPGADGKIVVGRTEVGAVMQKRDAAGNVVVGADGKPQGDVPIPFGTKVYNPNTGKGEDTISTFRKDMDVLAKGLTRSGVESPKDLTVNGNSFWAPHGYWIIENRGTPITLIPGQKLTVGDKEVTIPKDPDEARKVFSDMRLFSEAVAPTATPEMEVAPTPRVLGMHGPTKSEVLARRAGKRAELEGHTPDNPVENRVKWLWMPGLQRWYLGYAPGFTEKLPSVDELEKKVDENNAKRGTP